MLMLYVGADTQVSLKSPAVAGLLDASNLSSVISATVTYTLKDTDDAAVAGASAISMAYAAATEAYQGVVQSTVTLVAETTYYMEITATNGGDVGFWRIECLAIYQKEAA